MKVDSDGYAVFYHLGTNKVNVPTSSSEWPKGNKLVSPFVYQDDKLVGFIDTKSLIVSDNTTIYLPYEHIEAEFSAIEKGKLQIHAPNATTKKASWKDSGKEDIPEVQYTYKGCKTVDDVMNANYHYLADMSNGTWSEPLWDLVQGGKVQYDDGMFKGCTKLETFSSDLPNLTDGSYMFYDTKLASFSSDLSSLKNGDGMFSRCYSLTSFNSNLHSLTNGDSMFSHCNNLTSFNCDLSSLENGYYMFNYCDNLASFSSDLSSLKNGDGMFVKCKLDVASVQHIADTINTPSSKGTIHIGIGNSTPNEQEETAFNTIASKNWTVYVGVNGGNPSEWNPTSLIPIDGEETTNPIPYWAKPVQSDEQHAHYVDEQGNFYNILGGNYIYGDNLENYGMFISEEDAAANMRLTKIEK